MGNKLSSLFDFQKYEKNEKMQAVIDSVHARYAAVRLSDDDVEWVAAAGMPNAAPGKPDPAVKKDGFP